MVAGLDESTTQDGAALILALLAGYNRPSRSSRLTCAASRAPSGEPRDVAIVDRGRETGEYG